MLNYFKNIKDSFKLKHYLNYIVVGGVFALILVLNAVGALNRSTLSLLTQIGYSVILAVSLNLVVGFLGELSLGHAGFMCIGAYLGTLVGNFVYALVPSITLSLVVSMVVGGIIAAIFGFVVGMPALRLRGDYLAIVTLAFGEIVRNICRNIPFLGGALGLSSDIYTAVSQAKYPLFIPTFIALILMLVVIQNLIRSKHGRAITAVRDNEIAAKSMGVNVTFYKLFVFIVSAFFAGVAGALYGAFASPVNYGTFDYNYSIEILVMVVLGGMGSINGSIIAATLITLINNYLKAFLTGDMAAVKTLVYALILIVMVIYKNAPALKTIRERFTLKNILGMIFKKKADLGKQTDDDARWDVVTTKIEMNEVLSTDLVVEESVTSPDREGGES